MAEDWDKGRGRCPASGKPFLSHDEASRSARRIRRRNAARGESDWLLREYRCEDCGWWHVGHETVEKARARRVGAVAGQRRRGSTWRRPTSDGYERLGLTPPQR